MINFKKEILNFVISYVVALILIFLLALSDASFSDAFGAMITLFTTKQGLLFFIITGGILYLLYLTIRYFIRVFKKRGVKQLFTQLFIRLCLPITVIVLGLNYIIHKNTTENFEYQWDYSVENVKNQSHNYYSIDGKYRGMTVYNIWSKTETTIDKLIKTNVEWISIFPYIAQKNETSPQINLRDSYDVLSPEDSLLIKSIKMVHKRGMSVMLKPHIWLIDGWRGNINLNSEEQWHLWFSSYRKAILHFAKIAAKTNVSLFCIGTELKSSIKNQPEAWEGLIDDIRAIYSGKLTYAANWDSEYKEVRFWNKLDFIGVQGYFPLTTQKSPDLKMIKEGWKAPIKALEKIATTYNKPILFTEVGYRNDNYATVNPWNWAPFYSVLYTKRSDETQYLAYKALFSELWDKEWFAGLYAWQWNSGDFPIRNKPAANVIAKWYGIEPKEAK